MRSLPTRKTARDILFWMITDLSQSRSKYVTDCGLELYEHKRDPSGEWDIWKRDSCCLKFFVLKEILAD